MENVERGIPAARGVLRHMLENQDVVAAYEGEDCDEDAHEALEQPMMVPVWGPATLVGQVELLASAREAFGDESSRPVWANQWIAALLPASNAGRDSYVEVDITPRQYLDGEILIERPGVLAYNHNGPETLRLMDRRHGDDSPVAFTVESYSERAGWIVQAEHGSASVEEALEDLQSWYPAPAREAGDAPSP